VARAAPRRGVAAGLPRDIKDEGVLITRDGSHDVWAFNVCLAFH
jgi:hypothetical protein